MDNSKKIMVASSLFDDLKAGEINALPMPSGYAVLADEEVEPLKTGDKVEFVDAEEGDIISGFVKYVLVVDDDGGYVAYFDVSKNEHIYVVDNIPKVSVNQIYSRRHFGFIQGVKDNFKTVVWKAFGKTRIYYNCDVEYTFLFKGKLLDPTNCFGMIKIIEDIIVINDAGGFIRSNKVRVGHTEKGENDKVIIKIIY